MDHQALILGELREFKKATLKRLETIETKIDSFQRFRSKIIGMATAGAIFSSVLIEVVKKMLI